MVTLQCPRVNCVCAVLRAQALWWQCCRTYQISKIFSLFRLICNSDGQENRKRKKKGKKSVIYVRRKDRPLSHTNNAFTGTKRLIFCGICSSQGMLAIIRCGIFRLPVCYPKYKHKDIQNQPVVLYGCETWSLTLMEERRLRVFENRVLRPKRDEVTGDWIKLHNEELNDLYFSPNIVRVIKSSRMRWAGHVTCIPIRATCPAHLILLTGFWRWNLRERDHSEDPGADGRIILSWIFRNWVVGALASSIWLRIGTGGGHLWMR